MAGGAAAIGAAVGGPAAAGVAGSEPPTRGGEERSTWGRKARPPWVLTMLRREKENE